MSHSTPNLLLLTVDAWRADFVDEYDGIALTPTLSQLQPRAVRFANAYANGPWTSPALVSLFTGENPARHGVHYEWSAPRPGGPALCTALQAAGYFAPNISYLNRVGNYQNLGYSGAAPDYPASPADEGLQAALRSTKEPWFLWYHYKFVHLPYWPGPAYRRLFSITDGRIPARLRDSVCSRFVVPRHEFSFAPEDRELVRRLYAGGVRQMDDFLLRVWETLSQCGLEERTTLVLTADHGEELLEHGHVGHASTAHHATLYEEVLRVPLFIIDPRVKAARTVEARVQGIDLFPTLLSLCGVSSPTPRGQDQAVDLSAFVLSDDAPPGWGTERRFFFESARMGYLTPKSHAGQLVSGWSDGKYKYIFEQYDTPRQLLFDLRRDPHEEHPSQSGLEVEAAHAELLAWRGQG